MKEAFKCQNHGVENHSKNHSRKYLFLVKKQLEILQVIEKKGANNE